MPKTNQALRRYRIILKILSRTGKHASKEIHQSCINSGIIVSYRTIQKDLEDLRDDNTIFSRELGIIEDKKTKKWYSDNIPKELYATLELGDGEVDALIFYTKTLNQYSNYPIFREISEAMKKVFESSNIPKQVQDLFQSETWIETEKHEKIKGIELIPEVLDAIHRKKIIKIEYQRFEDNVSKIHVFEPLLLKEDKQMWYVIGLNFKYKKYTTYALDRIISIIVTDEEYVPQLFNSKEYFKYSFGITVSDEEPIDVMISFSPKQANYLKTLNIHHTQRILIDNSESFVISIKVKPSYEFYSKILSYGDNATIISPPYLRTYISNIIKQTLNNYM